MRSIIPGKDVDVRFDPNIAGDGIVTSDTMGSVDTFTGIEGFSGSSNDDSIIGGAGTQFLYGGAGNDTIDGGADFDKALLVLSRALPSNLSKDRLVATTLSFYSICRPTVEAAE